MAGSARTLKKVRLGVGSKLAIVTLAAGCDEPDCFHFARNTPYEVTLQRYVGPPQGSYPCGEGRDLAVGDSFRFRVLKEVMRDPDDECSTATAVRIDSTTSASLALGEGPSGGVGFVAVEAPHLLFGTSYEVQLAGSPSTRSWTASLWAVTDPSTDAVLSPYNPETPMLYFVRSLDPETCADEWEVALSRVDPDAGPAP